MGKWFYLLHNQIYDIKIQGYQSSGINNNKLSSNKSPAIGRSLILRQLQQQGDLFDIDIDRSEILHHSNK